MMIPDTASAGSGSLFFSKSEGCCTFADDSVSPSTIIGIAVLAILYLGKLVCDSWYLSAKNIGL